MSSSTFKNPNTKRRLESLLRRERLRGVLKICGVALLGIGLGLAILPFGPPVSNPVVIPNVDPHAGLALLQMLSSDYLLYLGMALALLGAIVLACSTLLENPDLQNGND